MTRAFSTRLQLTRISITFQLIQPTCSTLFSKQTLVLTCWGSAPSAQGMCLDEESLILLDVQVHMRNIKLTILSSQPDLGAGCFH
eukprot:1160417-Pelagomonas_calceolata.AAC.1